MSSGTDDVIVSTLPIVEPNTLTYTSTLRLVDWLKSRGYDSEFVIIICIFYQEDAVFGDERASAERERGFARAHLQMYPIFCLCKIPRTWIS